MRQPRHNARASWLLSLVLRPFFRRKSHPWSGGFNILQVSLHRLGKDPVRVLTLACSLLVLVAALPSTTGKLAWQPGAADARFKEANAPITASIPQTVPPGGRWTVDSPSPSEFLVVGSGAYDSKTGEIVLFGGVENGYIFTNIWVYNYSTDKWSSESPYPHPSAGVRAAMVYDSKADRFVVFGGLSPHGTSNETWIYDLNTNAWTQMRPALSPSARYSQTMAYDTSADRVILFGGHVGPYQDDGSEDSLGANETWAYDLNSNIWTNMNPSSKPTGRSGHAMAYDAQAHRTVVEGGRVSCNTNIVPNPSCMSGETWAYDFAANAWAQRATGPAQVDYAMAYDLQSNRVVLFCPDPNTDWMFDTWSYDYASDTWTNRAPSSSPRGGVLSPVVYDAVAARTALFYSSWVWTYDFSSNNWSSRPLPSNPGYRWSFGLAYDGGAAQTILFGGYAADISGAADGETWAYYATTREWRMLAPVVAPSPRAEVGTTYASRHDRIVLFGGAREQAHLVASDETWLFDSAQDNWSNPNPAVRPPARRSPGLAYDSGADRVVLFGGAYPGGIPERAADTWIYDITNNTWTNVTPVVSPSARESPSMAYDPRSGKIVLFGGIATGAREWASNETWLYDVRTSDWTNVTLANSPAPRGVAPMAYDAALDRIILFGGSEGDTWLYDAANNTWVQLEPVEPSPNVYSHGLVYDSKAERIILYGGIQGDVTWSYIYAPPVPPGPVTWDTSAAQGSDVRFSWLPPVDHGGAAIESYRVYRGTSPSEMTYVNTTWVTRYSEGHLEGGVTYYYRVRAVNAAGEGTPSEALVITTAPTGGFGGRSGLLIVVPAVATAVSLGTILFFLWRRRHPPGGPSLVQVLKK